MISPIMSEMSEAQISREVQLYFKNNRLESIDYRLPGGLSIDYKYIKSDGTVIFVEILNEIDNKKLSKIIQLFTSIKNIDPKIDNYELYIIGNTISPDLRNQLNRLNIKVLKVNELRKKTNNTIKKDDFINLSSDEAKLIALIEIKKKSVFSIQDVKKLMNVSDPYVRNLLMNLVKKGWVERIKRGKYQAIPLDFGYPERISPLNPYLVGANLVDPYYFSYYTSNSYYGFTTQIPSKYYIATTKKQQTKHWNNRSFNFVTIGKKKFFGFQDVIILGEKVKVATPEKSIVDSFDKPKYAGGLPEVTRVLWKSYKQLNKSKLINYAIKMQSSSLIQRLGYIIELLEEKNYVQPLDSVLKDKLINKMGKTVIYLDRNRSKNGILNKKWNIITNIEVDDILSEILIR